jgi:hypothetical protein
MAEYEKKVRAVLKMYGFVFHHHGKGFLTAKSRKSNKVRGKEGFLSFLTSSTF